VYFSDIERRTDQPAIVAARRTVDIPAVARGALQRLFAGPTQPEIARGLQFFPGRVTGFTDLSVRDGVARVRLLGGCPAPPGPGTDSPPKPETWWQYSTLDETPECGHTALRNCLAAG